MKLNRSALIIDTESGCDIGHPWSFDSELYEYNGYRDITPASRTRLHALLASPEWTVNVDRSRIAVDDEFVVVTYNYEPSPFGVLEVA